MNPNTSIRPWLLAVGRQFGINQAHDYQWNDASTRPQEEYFTYRITGARPDQDGAVDQTSDAGNNIANRSAWQRWVNTIQIDLYRSENGMAELAACIIAAQTNESIQALFQRSACSFFRITENAKNLTEVDSDYRKEDLHHQITVEFYDHPSVSMEEVDAVVDEVIINLSDWD
jgi:hypothetical protein